MMMTDLQPVRLSRQHWFQMILLMTWFPIASTLPVGASELESAEPPPPEATVLLIVGEPGTEEYARMFAEWADRWKAAAERGGASMTIIGQSEESDSTDFQQLQEAIAVEHDGSGRPLWIVLIGHGTFDGRAAKFNLRRPDFTAAELSEWLAPIDRPVAIINCASASAPFIDRLTGPNRVIVTATRSGAEANFTRFGDYVSQAVMDLSADLDKDGQVSLLEAFLTASRNTQAHYDGQRQLATEHALLEDNGDARGVRAELFTGIQPAQQAAGRESLDGRRAHQWHLVPSDEERRLPLEVRRRRDELELKLAELRDRKSDFTEDEYYTLIEPLLLEIARLYDESVEPIP